MLANLRQFRAGSDQSLGEVTWMASGKAQAFDPRHIMNRVEQIGEGVLVASSFRCSRQIATVSINVLAQQSHFLIPLLSQNFHLGSNCFWGTRLFLPAHAGYDAIRAALIAAIDDIHPSCHRAIAAGFGNIFNDVNWFCGDDLIAIQHLF